MKAFILAALFLVNFYTVGGNEIRELAKVEKNIIQLNEVGQKSYKDIRNIVSQVRTLEDLIRSRYRQILKDCRNDFNSLYEHFKTLGRVPILKEFIYLKLDQITNELQEAFQTLQNNSGQEKANLSGSAKSSDSKETGMFTRLEELYLGVHREALNNLNQKYKTCLKDRLQTLGGRVMAYLRGENRCLKDFETGFDNLNKARLEALENVLTDFEKGTKNDVAKEKKPFEDTKEDLHSVNLRSIVERLEEWPKGNFTIDLDFNTGNINEKGLVHLINASNEKSNKQRSSEDLQKLNSLQEHWTIVFTAKIHALAELYTELESHFCFEPTRNISIKKKMRVMEIVILFTSHPTSSLFNQVLQNPKTYKVDLQAN